MWTTEHPEEEIWPDRNTFYQDATPFTQMIYWNENLYLCIMFRKLEIL